MAGGAKEQKKYWQSIFASPIAARLNQEAPRAGLVASDITFLMSLCPLETLAKGVKSHFCDLFTEEEFEGYEYYQDLENYYGFGYVSSLLYHQLTDRMNFWSKVRARTRTGTGCRLCQ